MGHKTSHKMITIEKHKKTKFYHPYFKALSLIFAFCVKYLVLSPLQGSNNSDIQPVTGSCITRFLMLRGKKPERFRTTVYVVLQGDTFTSRVPCPVLREIRPNWSLHCCHLLVKKDTVSHFGTTCLEPLWAPWGCFYKQLIAWKHW